MCSKYKRGQDSASHNQCRELHRRGQLLAKDEPMAQQLGSATP